MSVEVVGRSSEGGSFFTERSFRRMPIALAASRALVRSLESIAGSSARIGERAGAFAESHNTVEKMSEPSATQAVSHRDHWSIGAPGVRLAVAHLQRSGA